MAHALAQFFDYPAQAAPARRSLAGRVLDAIVAARMEQVRREILRNPHLHETLLAHGDFRRFSLSDEKLPFGR